MLRQYFKMLISSYKFSSVLSICLLCICTINAQDNEEETIDLFKEQVCYFPDYEWISDADTVQQQQLNTSGFALGAYLATSHPSRCAGLGILVESCFEQRIEPVNSIPVDIHRIVVFQYRDDKSMLQYDRINRVSLSSRSLTALFECENASVEWIVEKGDIIVVDLSDCSVRDTMNHVCPTYPIFRSWTMEINNNASVLTRLDRLPMVVPQDSLISPISAFLNIRTRVIPTPPTLPLSCDPALSLSVCTSTMTSEASHEDNRFIVGEVDINPDPRRRFWGGGTYIMPYRAPTIGTAVRVNYTALLNSQGNNNETQFEFYLAQMRETTTQYELIESSSITTPDNIATSNNFTSTIYSNSQSINFGVQEGDLFAVFVPNTCENGVCPTQVNLLNINGECQSSLYYPSFGTGVETISKNNTGQSEDIQLRPAPITVNINIEIVPSDPNYQLPLCSPVTTLPSTAPPTTRAPTFEEEITEYASIVGSVILVLIIVVILLVVFVVVIFVILRKQSKVVAQQSHNIEMTTRVYDEVVSRDIAVTPLVHVEVNERGRFRRRTIDIDSQHDVQRARAYSRVRDYSRVDSVSLHTNHSLRNNKVPLLAAAQTNDNPTYSEAATNKRVVVADGNVTANYQMTAADYSAPVVQPAVSEEGLKTQLAKLGVDEIPQEQLQMEEEIGRGQFGTVYRAKWEFSISDDEAEKAGSQIISAYVAVKMMDGSTSHENRIKFLQEAVLIGQFNDPNIVSVFGIITRSDKLMMICELMDEDLRCNLSNIQARLRNNEVTDQERSELPALLLSYCRKIASTFVYLGLKRFVHRDLAARNILVSKEGDCKIADFGMSRDLQDNEYYKSHGGMVPVKWTAPEALLYKKYSFMSDVWSFGMLLYEIWSLGCKPYQNMNNSEVLKKIQEGYRLPPPPGCPRAIYELIIKCTHPEAESRPSFTNILTSLQRPDYKLLQWSESEGGSEGARTLGGPLEDGETLYTELQNAYI